MRYAVIVAQQINYSVSPPARVTDIVYGTLRANGAGDLRILAGDRAANGEAFAGESVVRLPRPLSRRIRRNLAGSLISTRCIGLRSALLEA